jgi:hypothetical protein
MNLVTARRLHKRAVRARWTLRILAREGGIRRPHRVVVGSSMRTVPDPFARMALAAALVRALARKAQYPRR